MPLVVAGTAVGEPLSRKSGVRSRGAGLLTEVRSSRGENLVSAIQLDLRTCRGTNLFCPCDAELITLPIGCLGSSVSWSIVPHMRTFSGRPGSLREEGVIECLGEVVHAPDAMARICVASCKRVMARFSAARSALVLLRERLE